MADLHDDILKCLVDNGYLASWEEDILVILIELCNKKLPLFCKLGTHFPYELPTIYLSNAALDQLPSIPHKYRDKSLCLFDSSVAFPNINHPCEIVLDCVRKAEAILKEGMEGTNQQDFIDEFLAYWGNKHKTQVQMFVDGLDVCKKLILLGDGKEGVIVDADDDTQEHLAEFALKNKPNKRVQGLLIPLNIADITSIPHDDLEIIDLIRQASSFWNQYQTFLRTNYDKRVLVVFTKATEQGYLIAGWIHYPQKTPSGFRAGKAPFKILFSKSCKEGIGLQVDNCSQKHLFSRGGDDHSITINNACVIGCGSLGSHIAEALLKYGTKHFSLVDNERLSYDNIGRHYTGYCFVGQPKVDAIGFSLHMHNPNIECDTFFENAFDFFESHLEDMNQSDLIVIATASPSIEHFVNELIQKQAITAPIIFIWTEPYAVAGQAILVNSQVDLYKEQFDRETLEFRNPVVVNGLQYTKREAGCQSSFIPYSAFRIQEMIYRILDIVINDLLVKKHSFRITWCGALSEARKNGFIISDRYADAMDYSVDVERID